MISRRWLRQLLVFASACSVNQTLAQTLEPLNFRDLHGWAEDDHDAARRVFLRSCDEIEKVGSGFRTPVVLGGAREHWNDACRAGRGRSGAREFFESAFVPFRVRDEERPEGLFTGYYEPEFDGSQERTDEFAVPVYGKPPELVRLPDSNGMPSAPSYGLMIEGQPALFHSRREIEQGALAGRGLEIVWLRDWADAFFMQIQGSGRIRLRDGSVMRLAFAAKSGRPYTSIGGVLEKRGLMTREQLSMQSIRKWMAANPQAARKLMWENESFVFFREVQLERPELGSLGAQHVQLSPERSIAIDRRIWMFGTPIWLETEVPAIPGHTARPFRRLLIAQDTGSAIRGKARGDVFWGSGNRAEAIAGHMKSPGRMVVLLPKMVALFLKAIP